MQRETELQLRWIVKWESTGNSGHAGTLESTDNRGGSGGGGGGNVQSRRCRDDLTSDAERVQRCTLGNAAVERCLGEADRS